MITGRRESLLLAGRAALDAVWHGMARTSSALPLAIDPGQEFSSGEWREDFLLDYRGYVLALIHTHAWHCVGW